MEIKSMLNKLQEKSELSFGKLSRAFQSIVSGKRETVDDKAGNEPATITDRKLRAMIAKEVLGGVTQGKIARECGIAPASLSRFLRGGGISPNARLKLIEWISDRGK